MTKENDTEFTVKIPDFQDTGKTYTNDFLMSYIQTLVDKFGVYILLKPKDSSDKFITAFELGWRQTKTKTVAVAKRRLQENAANHPGMHHLGSNNPVDQ